MIPNASKMATYRNKPPEQRLNTSSRRPWLRWLGVGTGFIALLALAVFAVLNGVIRLIDLVDLRERWAALKPVLMVWRLGLITTFVAGYPYWVNWLARRQSWPSAQQAAVLKLRWHIAGVLAMAELLIGQQGLAVLVQWLITGQS